MTGTIQRVGKLMIGLSGIILSSVCLWGAKPDISVSASAVSPRLHVWSADESIHWRTLLSYNQDLSKSISVSTVFDVGSDNPFLRNPFRVYSFSLDWTQSKMSLSAGRLNYWSGLTHLRYDGMELGIDLKKYGKLTLLGGVEAVPDFSDTNFTQNTTALISWNKGTRSKYISISAWNHPVGTNQHTLGGFQYGLSLKTVKLKQYTAWDLTAERLHTLRIQATRSFEKHRVTVGYRQKRFMAHEVFPWVTESIIIRPTVTLGIRSRLNAKRLVWSQLSYRLQNSGTIYWKGTLLTKKFQFSTLAGFRDNTMLIGGSAGIGGHLLKQFNWGSQVSVNAMRIGDVLEPIQSKGLYAWLEWSPGSTMQVRLFTQLASNPYYKLDGRGGLTIHVAL